MHIFAWVPRIFLRTFDRGYPCLNVIKEYILANHLLYRLCSFRVERFLNVL